MKKASLNAEKQSSGEREPWPRAKLGEVCEEVRERIASAKVAVEDYVTTDNMVKNRGGVVVAEYVPENVGLVRYQKGDVLIANIRPYLKKIWLADKEGGCSSDVVVLRLASKELTAEYLYAALSQDAFFDYVMLKPRGTKMPRGDRNWLKQFEIPLPPLSVQRAVVARLEGEMKAVKRLEAGFREMAKAAEAAFAAELAEAFAAGAGAGEDGGNVRVERVERVEENGRVEHKEHKEPGLVGAGVPARPRGASGGSCVSASAGEPAEGGFFNAEKRRNGEREPWPKAKLGEVFDIARGGSPRPIKEYLTTAENGLNWIKIGDAVKGSKYITAVHEKIKPEGLHKTRRVYKGDLLLSNSMSFGQPYILGVDGCIHDGWLVLHPKQEVSQDFFFYLLSSPLVKQQFARLAVGGVVQNLNSDKVRGVEIPLPPLAVQRLIVSRLEAAAGRRARIVALAAEGAAAAADLRKAILKETFE